MEENKSAKPKSFRITEDTAEEFKKISAEIGGNQQETLAKLIECYEFQKGKVALQDKKADLEKFEQYVGILSRMYMQSLEDNQSIEDVVRQKFEALLMSKDSVIQELQNQIEQQKNIANTALEETKESKKQVSSLQETILALEKAAEEKENVLKDKESLISALTDSRDEYKEKVLDVVQKMDAMQEEYKELDKAKEEIKKLNEMLAEQKQLAKEEELEHSKQVLEIQRDFQNQIEAIKETKNKEVDMYQQKYVALLEKLESNQKK